MPYIVANGISIYYETHGHDNNPPLVLVGGLSRDHNIWNSVLDYLTSNFKVIIYDNRGAGQSDKPQGPYNSDMLGEDLADLLNQLNIQSAIIVGHSMGGFAAQYLAAKHPEKVDRLILLSTCSKQPEEGIIYLTQRLELIKAGATSLEVMIRSSLPWLHTSTFLTEDKIQTLIKNAKNNQFPQPREALEAQVQACINHDATEILRLIMAPTLVITGKEDKIMTPAVSLELKNQIEGAKLVIVENSAHMLQTETPEEICEVIKEFTMHND